MKIGLGIRMSRAAAIVGLAALLAGCETSSPSTDGVDDFFNENPVVIEPGSVNPEAPMRMSPQAATLETDSDVVTFSVDGGRPPFTWAVNDVSRGSIVETGSASAAYQRSDSGDNVVICSDSRGHTVMAVIRQP